MPAPHRKKIILWYVFILAAALSLVVIPAVSVNADSPVSSQDPDYLNIDFEGNITRVPLSADGVSLAQVSASDAEGTHSLEIPQGTAARDQSGNIVNFIHVAETLMPPLTPDQVAVSQSLAFEPSGITFSQPVLITIGYSVNQVPQNVSSIGLAYYTSDSGWISLPAGGGSVAASGQARGQVQHFTTFAVIAALSPADFKLSNLTIIPSKEKLWSVFPFFVRIGREAQIAVNVTNVGGMEGSYTGLLKINSDKIASQELTLKAGQEGRLTFKVSGLTEGDYSVEIGTASGKLETTIWINWQLIAGFFLALAVVSFLIARHIMAKRKNLLT